MIRSFLAALVVILMTGCASRQTELRMMVSGPPGVPFTANYEFGGLTVSVRNVTSGGGFDTFLEVPAGDGHCEVIKDRPTDELSVVAFEKGIQRINGFVPMGKEAIRFTREGGVWRYQTRP